MGFERVILTFNKPLYMIGDNVTGKLMVGVNKKEEKIRGIKIKVTGILSMTYWEVREILRKTFTTVLLGSSAILDKEAGEEVQEGREEDQR